MAMTEHLFHWKREPANRPRSRVREPGDLFDLSSAVDLQDGRITARVEDRHRGMRVHTPAGRSRRPLSPGMRHQNHTGQSFRTPFQKKTHAFLSVHPNPVSVRAHAAAWLLAEHRRDSIWQNDPYLPAAYPSAISRRTQSPHPQGHRGNQRRACSPSVEKLQGSRFSALKSGSWRISATPRPDPSSLPGPSLYKRTSARAGRDRFRS